MRRVLVDHSPTRDARKRGDGDYKVPLNKNTAAADAPEVDLVDLDRALAALTAVDERKSRVIEMRFFGGMTVEECYARSITDPLSGPGTKSREWNAIEIPLQVCFRKGVGCGTGTWRNRPVIDQRRAW